MHGKWSMTVILCLSAVLCHAQRKHNVPPDYKYIGQVTHDKSSEFYYPPLLSRYAANDTTLTAEQFKMLYYGAFFQDGYAAFNLASPFDDSLKALFDKDSLTPSDRRNIIRYTKADLERSPLSLKDLFRMYRMYNALEDDKNADIYFYKLNMLGKVISATGDALTDSSGIHVLCVDDEYAIISLLGYEFGGKQRLTGNQCDYLTLKDNSDGLKGLYFDVKQIFNSYSKALKSGDTSPVKKK
jgi:Domain of unknown function (DUF4919)